jgi:superfamily II DNA or RNA helicase
MSVELTEALLAQAAGWEVMKRARVCLAQGQVASSYWAPPLLRGVVLAEGMTFRGSLVIHNAVDIENLCNCREARQWGKICVHGVAVGLHWLQARKNESPPAPAKTAVVLPAKKTSMLRREAGGEPAELCLILPPNFDQAIARGKVMLVLEAKWAGGRCPLNALPQGRSFAFSLQDGSLIEQLETLTNGETPALLQLDAKDFAALIPLLVNHANLTLGKSCVVGVTRTPAKLPLRATLAATGEIFLSLGSAPGSGAANDVLVVGPASPAPDARNGLRRADAPKGSRGGCLPQPLDEWKTIGDWVWHNNTLQPLGLPPELKEIFHTPVRVPRSQVPQFLSVQWPQLSAAGGLEADFRLEDFSLAPQAPRFLLALKGGLAQLSALLQCAYGSRIMTVGVTAADEAVWLPDPDVPTRYSTRDFDAERAALSRLQRSGFSAPDSNGKLLLQGQNAVLNFLAREFPKLQREWSVTLDEQLENRTLKNIERVEPQFQITSPGVQWFDLGVVFAASGGETFSAADIQRLILSGQNHTRLKNGKMAVIDSGAVEELQEVLLDCAPQQSAGGYRIASTQAGFLEATLRQHADWKVQAPAAWRDRAAKQSGEATLECPPLGALENVLRPYQKQGVAWLHFLRANGFGGILADEMGLGKTLQTLAFIWTVRSAECGVRNNLQAAPAGNPQSAIRNPHLIVCPTSLVFNWLAEAKKFTPELKILALHGPDRHTRFAEIAASDVVVTSYALIRRDAEKYRGVEFDTVVLDEAQHIKNRQTQNAQAVKAVRAKHRLVLTGTPLENSVLDLWSIFDFLMPGYLGTAKDFRGRYELPIAKEKNAEAQTRLARRLRPFMLRRLKRDVAADLPAKIEQVSFCELTPDQRGVYQQVIEASRKQVLEAVGAQGLAKSRMVVLTALLRLRQICCDLRLLKLDNVNPANASGKLDLFGELLEEVIDGGHRVLVFSQFVGMLTLLKERLAAEKIKFCYLDGSTTDRGAVVEQFQQNDAIPVFLISLKAGGVGLNLTGADTVIHFDPWWNPAVEDQATDRAHRIGQTKVVTSYKLITRDTVEEKILMLQNRKRDVIQATLGGEEAFAASLNWEEIQELLA